MSPDRRSLIECMWHEASASVSPEQIAQRLLAHWAEQLQWLSGSEARLAAGFREIAHDHRAKTDVRDVVAEAEKYERASRRFARAAVLYRRLARGEPPFPGAPARGGST
jgi:hypothetical protein